MKSTTIHDVTGVILAGGASRRMGQNKALLPFQGTHLIQSVHNQLARLFDNVFIVTNSPELYRFLPCPKVSDLIRGGAGSLVGIHSALFHSTTPYVFIAACDMPYLQAHLILHIVSEREDFDIVVPVSSFGPEPLHAIYRKTVFDVIDTALKKGQKKIISIFDQLRVKIIPQNEIARIDPKFQSFRNINTPEEYNALTAT